MTTSSLDRYEMRAAVEGDLRDVAAMFDAADRALELPSDPVRELLEWVWHLSTVDLDRDTRIVLDGTAVVAYAQATWTPQEGGPCNVFARVHPEHLGAGIGTWLLTWAEGLARERGAEGIRAEAVDADEPGHALLRARGYRHVRSSFTMWKRLEPDEDPGMVPDGVGIRSYEDADERVLFETHEAAFADHWGFRPDSFENFNDALHGEDWDPSLVFLAEAGGQVVAYAVSYLFEHDGFVAILGVLKPWRGRGIAKALLRRAFAEIASRGTLEVRLGVDTQNPHGAVALYQGVGMTSLRCYDVFDLGTEETAEA